MLFNFKSIKSKYIFIGLIISLISLIIISVFSYFISFDIISELSDKWINAVVNKNSAEINNWFTDNKEMINSMVFSIQASGDFSEESLRRQIEKKMESQGENAVDFYIGFEDEKKIISGVGWEAPPDYDAREREWYIRAKKNDEVIFTEPYVDAMTGEMIITVAKRLEKEEKLVGVLAKDIYLTDIVNFVHDNKINENSYGMLFDSKGRIIVHPNNSFLPTEEGLKSPSEIDWPGYKELLEEVSKSEQGSKIDITGYDGSSEYIYYSRIPSNGWYYATSIEEAEYKGPLDRLITGFVWVFLISMIIAVFIMYRLIKSIITPIKSLDKTVFKFSQGDLGSRADIKTDDELGDLADSFNQMADTIEGYSNSLEQKVEEKTRELKSKNKTIMESIDYASRIQNALIPDLSKVLKIDSKKYFSIWKPRDRVGGDIFWAKKKKNISLLAVIDCTGHGVPGAFMSMMLNSIFNSVIREVEFNNPAQVLREVDTRLKNTLENNDDFNLNDGADIALISADTNTNKLIFAGAKLNLFKAENDNVEIIKGSRNNIGFSRLDDEFVNHILEINHDAVYYLSSDGFLDQNSKDNKFGMGKNGFLEFIQNINHLPLAKQKEIFEDDINQKLQEKEQRDDITIIGIKF